MLDTPIAVQIYGTAAPVRPPSFSERIVEAAATLLEGGDNAKYTVNEIVEVANVGISTLYSRFPAEGTVATKDAVTAALMHREMAAVLVRAFLDGGARGGGRALRRVVEAMVTRAVERPVMIRSLNLEWGRIRSREPGEPDQLTLGVQQCLSGQTEAERAHAKRAATEVVAMIRSVVDVAVANGERDVTALTDRLMGTVMHHLLNSA